MNHLQLQLIPVGQAAPPHLRDRAPLALFTHSAHLGRTAAQEGGDFIGA